MSKLKVMSDHSDIEYWNENSHFIEFTRDEGNCKLYTHRPWEVENETRDITKIAFIIEPYCLDKKQIDYIYDNYDKFDYILTHDDRLLTLPNAIKYYWAGMWGSDITQSKSKNLSMICSNKEFCRLHLDRLELARYIRDNHLGDTYGTFDSGTMIDTITAHSPYKFAIVIENYVEDYWFTEKIVNCLANKTVPIYLGARKINEIFDANGIIQVSSIDNIKELLKDFDYDREYEVRKDAIEHNYTESFKYGNIWDRLYNDYYDILK